MLYNNSFTVKKIIDEIDSIIEIFLDIILSMEYGL